MKKFKYLLLAIVAMVLCSCGYSVEYIVEDLRDEIKIELEKEYKSTVYVGDLFLVHEGGNYYTSIVEVTIAGETAKCTLNVVFDGKAYTWELCY